ncbi:MAG: nucleotidyl transferase AbiEii/AbiGii toxin family protein [bacterium]|nr:nucleotidyl transferase AbiEii/AbiGii toxin family protein [bacterium]
MDKLIENPTCYLYPQQRELLINLFKSGTIREKYFLTGGTALSVFYLHHRKSNDLDLFTINEPQFSDIEYWAKSVWRTKYTRFKMEPYILSAELNGVKVDFVHDPLSLDDKKTNHQMDGDMVVIDTLDNITSNKLSTLTGRQEPKDFIDFYFLNRMKSLDFKTVYDNTRKKEGMFDDPPMVAFQIENNLNGIKQNPYAFPEMMVEFDMEAFYIFYKNLIDTIYRHKV